MGTWGLVLAVTLAGLVRPAQAQRFQRTDLITDDPTVHPAPTTDANLVNPWGISFGGNTPFWVSDNGTGVSTLYNVNPTTNAVTVVPLVVSIPGAGNPTGQVFNGGSEFGGDRFLFVSEDGTISGWRSALGTNAEVLTTGDPANIYKGAALADVGGHSYLYAANFGTGAIDVKKGDSGAPNLTGNFTSPNIPSGFAPFNIQRLGDTLYVTYAKIDPADPEDDLPGPGNGFVNAFDLNGNLIRTVASGGALNSPWGLAIAPSTFGSLAGDLLVGNFGDGRINVFDPTTGDSLGPLLTPSGAALTIPGLWALTPGNDGAGGSSGKLYFTAGPNGETHGLFGVLSAVPEPSALALMGAGLAGVVVLFRRARRRR
jgi:uncharacterized protein (TIGR03118 family)